jgi:SAM-dependent methyltransferase
VADPSPPGALGRRLVDLNRKPFGRPEAAFYEYLAAPAVGRIVAPVLEEQLLAAPPGAVLDVGCGGGAIAAHLRGAGREVIGVEPSIPQLRRLRRTNPLPCAAGVAGALPVRRGAFAAVVASCAVKHWPSRVDGVAECAAALVHGGRLVLVEIDGGADGDLLRFAAHTTIPRPLRRLYPGFARRSFVPVSPTAEQLSAECATAGLSDVRSWRIEGLPFLVVVASR